MDRGKQPADATDVLQFRILRNSMVVLAVNLPWQTEVEIRALAEERLSQWHRDENQGEGLREYVLAVLVDLCDCPPPGAEQHTALLGLWLAHAADADGTVFGSRPAGIDLRLIGPGGQEQPQKLLVCLARRGTDPAPDPHSGA